LIDYTKKLYDKTAVKFYIKPFYENIAEILAKADIIICRSGASTIAELITLNKPSILVPFAAAKRNHQLHNALYLVENDAAYMLQEKDFSALNLAKILEKLIPNSKEHKKISHNLKRLAKTNAAQAMGMLIKNHSII
jgi:UDP-N-acetylglucosamine--N-acetylmuramyl-(pentapeptide) pyrophosphoryl-undecaprenol N-acetylglucosamine transferase